MMKIANRHSPFTAALVVAVSFQMMDTASAQCTLSADLDGNGVVNGADLGLLLIQWGDECPAMIDAVIPSAGPLTGGTQITIRGSNLGGVQSVMIDGIAATEVVQIDSSTITAVTPAGKSLGPKEVIVTTTGAGANLTYGFTYYNPSPGLVIIQHDPDPTIITDPELRDRIIATGHPWRVLDTVAGIELLLVPPGTFNMGCSPSDQYGCTSAEYSVHEVTLTDPFYLGRYEVTQAQWMAVTGSNPSWFIWPGPGVPEDQVSNRPVEQVSWDMIQEFEKVTGLRLPTEAEWEYACRAGTQTAFNLQPNGTNDDSQIGLLAWSFPNPVLQTHPVGLKQANNLGLHDMHGNVFEWVEDWYDNNNNFYSREAVVDPIGPPSGVGRRLRGGSYDSYSNSCRSSFRDAAYADTVSSQYGFRVARTP